MGPVMAPPPVVSAPPRWQHIPSVNGMEYAPGIHQDLFRYGGNYYQFHNGRWYQGPNYNGPWGMIYRPPQAFHQVEHHYWKAPLVGPSISTGGGRRAGAMPTCRRVRRRSIGRLMSTQARTLLLGDY